MDNIARSGSHLDAGQSNWKLTFVATWKLEVKWRNVIELDDYDDFCLQEEAFGVGPATNW